MIMIMVMNDIDDYDNNQYKIIVWQLDIIIKIKFIAILLLIEQ